VLFCISEFLGDKILGLCIISLVWLCELFTLICARTQETMQYFPRFFFAYFLLLHIYLLSYPHGFRYLAFFTMEALVQHAMIVFFNRFELPALQTGVISANIPRMDRIPPVSQINSVNHPLSELISPFDGGQTINNAAMLMNNVYIRGLINRHILNNINNNSTTQNTSTENISPISDNRSAGVSTSAIPFTTTVETSSVPLRTVNSESQEYHEHEQ